MLLCEFRQVSVENIAETSGGAVKMEHYTIAFFACLEEIFGNIPTILCTSRPQLCICAVTQLSVLLLLCILFLHLLDAFLSEVLKSVLSQET